MNRAVVLVLALTACGSSEPERKPDPAPAATAPVEKKDEAPKSLYERLGGKPAIELVVDAFLGNVAADPRINYRFAMSDLPDLRNKLVDQVCQATGGPCTYQGMDMKTAHTNMHVTDAEFTALVEDLIKALDQYKVPEKEKGELLGALGGLKGDIVGH
jgi:hemoglobin